MNTSKKNEKTVDSKTFKDNKVLNIDNQVNELKKLESLLAYQQQRNQISTKIESELRKIYEDIFEGNKVSFSSFMLENVNIQDLSEDAILEMIATTDLKLSWSDTRESKKDNLDILTSELYITLRKYKIDFIESFRIMYQEKYKDVPLEPYDAALQNSNISFFLDYINIYQKFTNFSVEAILNCRINPDDESSLKPRFLNDNQETLEQELKNFKEKFDNYDLKKNSPRHYLLAIISIIEKLKAENKSTAKYQLDDTRKSCINYSDETIDSIIERRICNLLGVPSQFFNDYKENKIDLPEEIIEFFSSMYKKIADIEHYKTLSLESMSLFKDASNFPFISNNIVDIKKKINNSNLQEN